MVKGQIIDFPCPEEYLWFITESEARLKIIIQALNLAHEKGYLDKRTFKGLLDYCGINIYRDLTQSDINILQFHITNYYELDVTL